MDNIMSSLGINPLTVVWHAVNFLILLVVLQRFLYRPVLKMLDDRATRIKDSMTQAETARAEMARLNDEARAILEEARREGQTLLAQANRNAERILSEARELAQQESERLAERARAELSRERDQAFAELRQEVADLAVMAAGHVIQRSLDDAGHRELVRQFIADGRQG
jgi:F-type H+-transporting ATPase subunit b